MHLHVILKPQIPLKPIPIHYNHLIQSLIYSSLPSDVATYLHDKGYQIGKRRFKLFSFSSLLGKFQLNKKDRTILFTDYVKLIIVSPDNNFLICLANNFLTTNTIRVGDSLLEVINIRFEEQVINNNVIFVRTLSPVVTYSTLIKPDGGRYTVYFHPGEKEFNTQISNNLRKKYEAFNGMQAPDGDIQIKYLDRPRLHITYFKDTLIKGYSCRFKIKGPQELLKMALDSSIGSKSSNGYGVIQLLERQHNQFS